MRDADELWNTARTAHASPDLCYLFEPENVLKRGFERVQADLSRSGISRRPNRDAKAWFTICETMANKWAGDPATFLNDCGQDAPTVLMRLRHDTHFGPHGSEPDFPLLRGPKIGPLWVRMLRDNCNIELKRLADVDIPVDVHVLRATLCSGAITGHWEGREGAIFRRVRQVWHEAVKGLVRHDGKPMVALDVDEALWTLSRRCCSMRGNGQLGHSAQTCPCQTGCVSGHIEIKEGHCRIATQP